MYLKRLPRWARMEAEHSKGHHFPIVASPINISTPVPSSLYVTQRYPYMIAQNQVSSYNPFRNFSVDTRTWTFIVAKLLPAIDKNRDKKDEGGDGPAQAAY